MGNVSIEPGKMVCIVYTNWKGETGVRRIVPEHIWFGQTQWHPEQQWLLHAFDAEKRVMRDFALKDIRSWFVEK